MGCGASASTSYEAPSGPQNYQRAGTREGRSGMEVSTEPKRSGPKKANHWHFQQKHTCADFLTAKKILEAYPETTQQKRTMLRGAGDQRRAAAQVEGAEDLQQ